MKNLLLMGALALSMGFSAQAANGDLHKVTSADELAAGKSYKIAAYNLKWSDASEKWLTSAATPSFINDRDAATVWQMVTPATISMCTDAAHEAAFCLKDENGKYLSIVEAGTTSMVDEMGQSTRFEFFATTLDDRTGTDGLDGSEETENLFGFHYYNALRSNMASFGCNATGGAGALTGKDSANKWQMWYNKSGWSTYYFIYEVEVEKNWVQMDRTNWTVLGCSEYNHYNNSGDGSLSDICDDDVSTFWHTDWQTPDQVESGHFFIVDLGESTEVGGIGYMPRVHNGGNGYVQEAAVYMVDDITGIETCVHGDANSYNTAAHGSLATFLEGKTAAWTGNLHSVAQLIPTEYKGMFDAPATGRYLIFQILSTTGDQNGKHANCAEFYAYVEGENPGSGDEPEVFNGDYAGITEWTSLGIGKFCDGFMPWADSHMYAFINGKTPWEAEIQEATQWKGIYRVVNPYRNCPAAVQYELVDMENDYYMWVDARVPSSCSIPQFCTGVTGSYAQAAGNGPSWAYAGNGVFDEEALTITWGPWSGAVNRGELDENGRPTAWQSAVDGNCNLMVALPGAPDYTFDYDAGGSCVNPATFTATWGEDITEFQASFTKMGEELNYQSVTFDEEGNLSFEMTEDAAYYLSVKFIGRDGKEKGEAHFPFFNYQANNDQWKEIGTGRLTEGFRQIFGGATSTFDVPVQENVNTPGFYRLVNPMSYNEAYANYLPDCGVDHYIFIHAEDPEAVTVDNSAIGLSLYGYGENIIRMSTPGKMVDGVIKFEDQQLGLNLRGYNNQNYYNAREFTLVIPQLHTVTVSTADTKYGTVAIEGAEGTTLETSATSVTVKATAAEGATFLYWLDAEGERVSTNATYVYEGSADLNLTAVFGFSVKSTCGEGGVLTVDTEAKAFTIDEDRYYPAETVLNVKATPATGFNLKSLTLNGAAFSAETYTLVANAEFAAEFEAGVHTVSIFVGGNGEVEAGAELDDEYGSLIAEGTGIKHGDKVNYGSMIAFVLKPANTQENVTIVTIEGVEGTSFTSLADLEDYMYPSEAPDCAHHTVAGPFQVTGDVKAIVEFSINTGIAEFIANGDEAAEIYNLQGVRVAASELNSGVYVVRQNGTARVVIIRK